MRYDISKQKAPEMSNLGKGTECVKLLLTQASKDMHEPLVPMFSQSLAHTSGYGFSIPGLQLEGADGHDGQLSGKKWR